MPVDLPTLERWMLRPEDERLEFKEARRQFGWDDLIGYMVALANEGGGHLVMGVTDRRPRQVCGTSAFNDPRNAQQQLTHTHCAKLQNVRENAGRSSIPRKAYFLLLAPLG